MHASFVGLFSKSKGACMRFRFAGRYELSVVLLGLGLSLSTVCAQAPPSKTDAEVKAEEAQALQLYNAQNFVAALPLYEDLHAQRPQSRRTRSGWLFACWPIVPEGLRAMQAAPAPSRCWWLCRPPATTATSCRFF